jgi:hypothetical protein
MGGPGTAAKTATSMIGIHGQGKLSVAPDANAQLLVVFGGVDVGVSSGIYMWNYMNRFKDKYHIFVAINEKVDGPEAYRALMRMVKSKSLTPSKQILYLFSGGYWPGMNLIKAFNRSLFSWIYLVDIWIGKKNKKVVEFYEGLASGPGGNITYVFTKFGANNSDARDFIADKLGPTEATLVEGRPHESDMQTHMRTNEVAVSSL